MEKLLSIVVPTKDRVQTAAHLISTILEWPGTNFELIVHDCGTEDALEERMRGVTDARLSYERAAPTSMTANWNAALSRCRGEFVIVVGDDDGVDVEVLRVAEWARSHDLDAVAYPWSAYAWPNFPDPTRAGDVSVPKVTGRIRFFDGVGETLERQSRRLNAILFPPLPRLYHGLVRRRIIQAHAARVGAFVRSYNPDIYSYVAFAPSIRRIALVEYPFSIHGYSALANSGREAQRTGMTERERRRAPHPHYLEYGKGIFHPQLPQIENFSVSTADTLITALIDAGRRDLLKNVDLADVYAACVVDAPLRALETVAALRGSAASFGASPTRAYARFTWRLAGRVALAASRKVVRPAVRVRTAAWLGPLHCGRANDIRSALAFQSKTLAGVLSL